MTFDRLLYIDRLKDAGVAEPVARAHAHAEALRDALIETVPAKSDIKKLDRPDDKFDSKIDLLDRKIEALDRKLDVTARDLIIKGAGGSIVIATLMIGLKLFG